MTFPQHRVMYFLKKKTSSVSVFLFRCSVGGFCDGFCGWLFPIISLVKRLLKLPYVLRAVPLGIDFSYPTTFLVFFSAVASATAGMVTTVPLSF